jgi:Tfp pilus assembly protein PilN
MSRINLVKQLKERRNATRTGTVPGLSGGGLKTLFTNLGATSNQLDQREKVLLILFFLGFGSIFATRTYLSAVYFPSQEEIVQQEMMQLDTQLSQINTKLAAYDSIKNDIESFERKMGEVREKLSVIESVQKGRNAIVRMVTLIVEEMPTALWLSQLKIETFLEKINPTLPAATAAQPGGIQNTTDKSIGSVSVRGNALSLQVVSQFIKELEGAVFFPKWNLVETRGDSGGQMFAAAQSGMGLGSGRGSADAPPVDSKNFEIQAKIAGLP